MPTTRRGRVAMFVFNNGQHDQRVHKQAQTLGQAGYEVRVYAFLSPGLPYREERPGYTLLREDQRSHLARWVDDRLLARWRRPSPPPPERPLERLTLPPDRPATRPCPRPERNLPAQARDDQRQHWAYMARINRVWAQRAAAWRPDLVQAHDLDALEAATLLGQRLGVPVLYDTHELWSEQPFIDSLEAVAYWEKRERRLLAQTDAVMTINEPLATILQQRYDLPEVLALHNCQEHQVVRQRPPHQPPIALYQGAYVPDRGCEQMLAAAAKLRHVKLAFRGFGPSESQLRQLAAGSPVEFWPPVPGPEVVQAAAQADIGVIPFLPTCLNHYYSTPNKLFEYMSAGLAIAGSDLPEIARFVNEYQLGRLFDPTSPSDIAEALDQIALSGDLPSMQRRARQATEERWSWEREVANYLALVERLIRGPRRSP